MKFEDDLYRDIILEHYKDPKYKLKIENAHSHMEGVNPSCGDEIELYLKFDVNGDDTISDETVIKEASFTGIGCSISQASASMLTEFIRGKSIKQVSAIISNFKEMLLEEKEPKFEDNISDLYALKGLKDYPVRIKCALLSWNTLEEMLKEKAKCDINK